MTYNFREKLGNYDICFKHDNCIVLLSLMRISPIILNTQKNSKSITYLSLLLFLSLYYHLIAQKHIFHTKIWL